MDAMTLFALPTSAATQPRLRVVPCELASGKAFVREHHRHLTRVVGHLFSLAVLDDIGALRGVAIVGRPVGRGNQDGRTVEVTRCATDGCPNACSALYAAANRERKRRGYARCITYTRADEPGTSLIAAGWRVTGRVKGRVWSCKSRARDVNERIDKLRWEAS